MSNMPVINMSRAYDLVPRLRSSEVQTGFSDKYFKVLYDHPAPKQWRFALDEIEGRVRKYAKDYCRREGQEASEFQFLFGTEFLNQIRRPTFSLFGFEFDTRNWMINVMERLDSGNVRFGLKLIEDLIWLVIALGNCTREGRRKRLTVDMRAVHIALIGFLKMRISDKALIHEAFNTLNSLYWHIITNDEEEALPGILADLDDAFAGRGVRLGRRDTNPQQAGQESNEFQAGEPEDNSRIAKFLQLSRNVLDGFDNIKHSEMYKKLYKFVLYLMGTSIFAHVGASTEPGMMRTLYDEAQKRQYHMGPNFIHCCLDTMVFLCERGYQFIKTRELSSLLHSSSSYDAWITRARKLDREYAFIHNPEAAGFTYFDYLKRLDRALDDGKSIIKLSKQLGNVENKLVSVYFDKLTTIRADLCSTEEALKNRKAPFAVVVFGGTSVGKSLFTRVVIAMYSHAFNRPLGDDYVYVRNSMDPYWVNFKTQMHTVVLDDVACLNPNKTTQMDPTIGEVIQVVNNVAFVPVQASLEEKGKTPLRSEFVVATTNKRSLHAEAYFSCPGAVLRRLPWVLDIKMKPEYAHLDGTLDGQAAAPPDMGDLPNYWIITVYKVVPCPDNSRSDVEARSHMTARYDLVEVFMDINDFCAWFVSTARIYREGQDQAATVLNLLKEVKLCMGRKVEECECESASCEHYRSGCLRPMTRCNHSAEGCQPVEANSASVDSASWGYSEDWCNECNLHLRECQCEIYGCPICWRPYAQCICYDESSGGSTMEEPDPERFICPQCGNFEDQCWCHFDFQSGRGQPRVMADISAENMVIDPELLHADYVQADPAAPEFFHAEQAFAPRTGFVNDGRVFEALHVEELTFRHQDNNMPGVFPREYGKAHALEDLRAYSRWEYYKLYFWMIILWVYRHVWGTQWLINWIFGDYWMVNLCVNYAFKPILWKICFRYIGSMVEHRVIRRPRRLRLLVGGLLTAGTAYAGFKLFTHFFGKQKTDPNNGVIDEVQGEVKPLADETRRANVWYKEHYETTPLDVGKLTIGWNNLSHEDVITKLSRNCVCLRFTWERLNGRQVSAPNLGFAVVGQYLITNAHAIPPVDQFSMDIIRVRKEGGITENITTIVTPADIKIFPSHDIALIRVRDIPPFADLRGLLPSKTLKGSFNGVYLGRLEDGELLCKVLKNMQRQSFVVNIPGKPELSRDIDIDTQIWRGNVADPMKKGQCGSIMLGFGHYGPVILGIHAFSSLIDENISSAVSLFREDLDQFMQDLIIVEGGVPRLSAQSVVRELTQLHKKSPFRFIESGVASVYGSIKGWRPSSSSSVLETPISESLQAKGYKLCHTAPVMKGWGPKRNALLTMTQPSSRMDPMILQHAADCYYNDIMAGVSEDDLSRLGPVDLRTAVNGVAGFAFVEPIKRSTSAGFPWMKSKKHFLEPDTVLDDGLMDPVRPTEEILEQVEDCLRSYKDGKRWCPVFCANLKDEAVSFAKRDAQKTRVFAGAPFPFVVVGRMFWILFLRMMYTCQFVFESAPGINCTSHEWEELYKYITFHGEDRMIAGDFQNFDKTMSARVIQLVFDVYIKVALASNRYPQWMGRAMYIMAMDIAFPFFYFFGDLVQFFNTNPSGHFMTVQVNGGANSIYMRYCYAVLSPDKSAKNFRKHVRLMTYGDDNIMSVSKDAPWFNHTAIARVLGDVGIVYTMADKSAESKPYCHISECTFLKRTWRIDEEVGGVMAPLERKSIEKSLLIGTVSKSVTREEQTLDAISSAVRESFHHGRDYYNQIVKDCKDAILENDLSAYVAEKTFPPYEVLIKEFHEAGRYLRPLPPNLYS